MLMKKMVFLTVANPVLRPLNVSAVVARQSRTKKPKRVSDMRIGQFIKSKGGSLSFEFFPPKDKAGEDRLLEDIARFEILNPAFVSVTYGAGGGTSKNTRHFVLRISQQTSLVPMPHLTCVDQNKNELEAILKDYVKHGIENVLALRGDPPKGAEIFTPPRDGFCYAKDLVQLAVSLSGFSIGVAVYPEGHCESPNLEMDMYYTKQKIDAGADFAITQMFFDNSYFYGFLDRVAKADIEVPVIAGIMAITDIERIKTFSKRCGATLPDKIIQQFKKVGTTAEEMKKVGIDVATKQCADLLEHGIRYFHFYTLNRSDAVLQIISNLGLQNLGAERVGGFVKSG
jgi:methylenetetrahydrofolate reductase (NADPH)